MKLLCSALRRAGATFLQGWPWELKSSKASRGFATFLQGLPWELKSSKASRGLANSTFCRKKKDSPPLPVPWRSRKNSNLQVFTRDLCDSGRKKNAPGPVGRCCLAVLLQDYRPRATVASMLREVRKNQVAPPLRKLEGVKSCSAKPSGCSSDANSCRKP